MASISQYEPVAAFQADARALSGENSRMKRLHVLTLTPFYPVADNDAAGCFVAEPLRSLGNFGIKNSVIAVRPFHRGRGVRANSAAHPATWMRYPAVPGMGGLVISGRALYLRIRAAVRRLHAAEPVNVIHAHAALPCGHAAALLARDLRIPFVITVHGRDVFLSTKDGLFGQWRQKLSKEVYRSAKRVICISEKVEEDLLPGAHCRSAVVHNGVDTDLFSPAIPQGGNLVVLSVGNLIPTKGHETLLRSVARIIGHYPLLRCQIIGIGQERQRLMDVTYQLGISDRVEFLGRQSRAFVAKAMQACSVFALPSRYEGLGCVYLEAMASGKPAIGCTGQGIVDIIKSGKNGWLVQPADIDCLANALHQLLGDPGLRNRIGMAGWQTVVENYTLRHQAERLSQIYEECVH
jgi:glycosyltransferase involved in cell wall biosynthesis